MVLISTFARSQKAAIREGYNNDINTYHIISGNLNNLDQNGDIGAQSKILILYNNVYNIIKY